MLIDNNRMDTLSIVNIIFAREPLPPYSYTVTLSEDTYNVTLFQLLMNILIGGAKKIYGEHITADQISHEQFKNLKKYMISIGYNIKYNYTYNDEDIATNINIWFEPYIYDIKCNGYIKK